jgi:hypothetical protein
MCREGLQVKGKTSDPKETSETLEKRPCWRDPCNKNKHREWSWVQGGVSQRNLCECHIQRRVRLEMKCSHTQKQAEHFTVSQYSRARGAQLTWRRGEPQGQGHGRGGSHLSTPHSDVQGASLEPRSSRPASATQQNPVSNIEKKPEVREKTLFTSNSSNACSGGHCALSRLGRKCAASLRGTGGA